MGDKQQQDYRRHIIAAKKWLGMAEESIDKDNDIRSDLNLMLAQAELQRAKEKDDFRLVKKWLKWTVPWGLALLVIVGYIYVLRPEVTADMPNNELSENTVEKSYTADEKTKNETLSQDVTVSNGDNKENSFQVKEDKVEIEKDMDNVVNESDNIAVKEDITDKDNNTAKETVIENKSILSEKDKQQMMQSAGQILRE